MDSKEYSAPGFHRVIMSYLYRKLGIVTRFLFVWSSLNSMSMIVYVYIFKEH